MSEEFETSWPMGSAPVGRKLERPRLPKGRLGEFRVLDVAIPELIAHARRQVPEIANEDLHVNGKMFTDKDGVNYRIARGFVDWTAVPEHIAAFSIRDGYLVPFVLEGHRGRESAVYLGSLPTATKVGGPTQPDDTGDAQIY